MPDQSTDLPILMYHALGSPSDAVTTNPSWFAVTVARLLDAGFECIDLDNWIASGRPPVKRGFALTFDDGDRSIQLAAHTLSKHRLSATAFIVTRRIGFDNQWPSQPRWVPKRPLLDWHELRDLEHAGFRFASHTRDHHRLDRLDDVSLYSQIEGACEDLASLIENPSHILAYPYGFSDARVRGVAARFHTAGLGTRLALTAGRHDRFDLPRIDACYIKNDRDLDRLTTTGFSAWLAWKPIPRHVRAIARKSVNAITNSTCHIPVARVPGSEGTWQ